MAHAVTQEADDKQQLAPMVEAIEQQARQKPEQLLADSGFCSEQNLNTITVRLGGSTLIIWGQILDSRMIDNAIQVGGLNSRIGSAVPYRCGGSHPAGLSRNIPAPIPGILPRP